MKLLNAYYDRGWLVLVTPGGEQRIRSDNSCYIKRSDYDDRLLSESTIVGACLDGDWARLSLLYPYVEETLKMLHERGIQTYEGTVPGIRRWISEHDVEIARPRRCFLDIETDSRVSVKQAADGGARILCWAVVGEDGREFVGCDDNERVTLEELWAVLANYDQVCAWNGDHFDFTAIWERTRRHGLPVNWKKWLWMDQLKCFERMHKMAAKSGEEKQSLALQSVGMSIVGEGKNDFDTSKTWEAWNTDRDTLVLYCLQDTRLLKKIEETTGYLNVHQIICEATGALPNSGGLRPLSQIETLLLRLGQKRGVRFPTRFIDRSAEDTQFEGAFVMDPKPGLMENVHVADFSGLYPSIIQTWNMSPETKVEEGGALATTEIRFAQEPQGLLSEAVTMMLKFKDKWKAKMMAAEKDSEEYWDAKRRSTAFKIAVNSFYGAIGAPLGRLFDIDVARSVTQAGVWLIKETIHAAEMRGYEAVYGDTDSLFIRGGDTEEFKQFVAWCNEELYPRLLREKNCARNHIELDYEKSFDRIVFIVKKRYAGRYAGTDALEIKGLEYMRGDSTRLGRKLQEEIVRCIMGGGDAAECDKILDRWLKMVLEEELDVDDIAISKRLSMPIEMYKRRVKKDGEWSKRPPHVEIASELRERGLDMREGVRVDYYLVDGKRSLFRSMLDFDGVYDRYGYWEKYIYKPTGRVVQAAFPNWDFRRFDKVRPRKSRKKVDKRQLNMFE